MGEEQKRWKTVWQNLQTYKSPLGTGPGDHDLFLVWNPPFRYQKYVITIFVWQFLTNLKLERMVKWWKYTCEGKYIFSVICCWKVLKCILDSIFDTNRSFRRPLIFGKENRLNPWHNAVFILIKEAESCILFMKLLNYIQKYLHWSWVYCPWKIFKRWHIFKVFELLFSVWAEQTVVVYPASELAARQNCPSSSILRPFQPKTIITVLNLRQIMMLMLVQILLQNWGPLENSADLKDNGLKWCVC